jgi:hypothetical protein
MINTTGFVVFRLVPSIINISNNTTNKSRSPVVDKSLHSIAKSTTSSSLLLLLTCHYNAPPLLLTRVTQQQTAPE